MKARLFNTYEPVTTIYRDLLPDWVNLGWQVEVVISKAKYRSGRDRSWCKDGVRAYETPNLGLRPDKPVSKLIIMMLYVMAAALHSLWGRTVDVNLFLTQPPLFFIWGYVLKKLRGQSYCVVLMDLYPHIAVQAGALSEKAIYTRIMSTAVRFALRRADGVIVIGRCMAERVHQMGVEQRRIHLIPNWIDQELLAPISSSENLFRREQAWDGKFVVLYSGNIGVSHYFDDLLEAARRLRTRPEILFVFIGNGARRHEIENYKARHSLENIVLLPFQALQNLAQSLSAGDLHFVSLRHGFEGVVVPSKTYGALAVGRPILYQGDSEGEIARIILEEDVGAVLPTGAVEELVVTIVRYAEDATLVKRQGHRARKLAEEQFSKQVAIERYTRVLSCL